VEDAHVKSIRVRTEGNAEGAGDDAEWQPRRRHDRCRLFRPAHVVVDDAVLDCVLVDISPNGAQVCLVAWAELPDRVTLLLPNAGSRPMRRRWQQGSFIGFEVLGDAVPLS
jgi:PilZ domain